MKILLLGKNGMLGQDLDYELRVTNYEYIAWARQDLDITNQYQANKKIKELKPDIIINAAAYTNVDGAEVNYQKAFDVNVNAVGYIAQACSQISARLIHFSTDYVFNGIKAQGYKEDNVKNLKPLNIYGKSKFKGELIIKNYGLRKYFIIRTSWLYGQNGKNFVTTIINRAQQGQNQFKIVNDQFGNPTYTKDLAQRVLWMIEHQHQLKKGIYHYTNKVKDNQSKAGISWYQFGKEIFKQAQKLGILSKSPKVKPCLSSEFTRPAKRPQYSSLKNTKLPKARTWQKALLEYLSLNFKS